MPPWLSTNPGTNEVTEGLFFHSFTDSTPVLHAYTLTLIVAWECACVEFIVITSTGDVLWSLLCVCTNDVLIVFVHD